MGMRKTFQFHCPHCGFGEGAGKCGNCGGSKFTHRKGAYRVSPDEIERFRRFHKFGGSFADIWPPKEAPGISIYLSALDGSWVIMLVEGVRVNFNEEGKIVFPNPEILEKITDAGMMLAKAQELALAEMRRKKILYSIEGDNNGKENQKLKTDQIHRGMRGSPSVHG